MSRLIYGAFIALSAAFVVSNIVQVVRVLFLATDATGEGPRGARVIAAEPCRRGLEALATGLERATAEASAARDATSSEAAYRARKAELDGPWGETARICASEPNGPDAMAALARLDRAAEATARRRTEALAPVRREVDSFIR